MTTSHKSQAFPMVCHRVLFWAQFSSSSTQNLFLTWFSVTVLSLNLSRTILTSKSLSLLWTFRLQYLPWKPVCQTSRSGCWKTNLTMMKQRPSSCAHLPSPFQSPNLLPSLSVAVKYLFLLLPEILVFTSDMSMELHIKNVCRSAYSELCRISTFGIFFPLTLQKHLCPPLFSPG